MDSFNASSRLETPKNLSENNSRENILQKFSSLDENLLPENVRSARQNLQKKVEFLLQNNQKIPTGVIEMMQEFLAKNQKNSTISKEKISEIFS